jgi:multiple sugar transport system ATP-binding protein
MTLADQIVVLHEGKVQQIGSPQQVYAHPVNSMVAGFLGNPPMNILSATYNNDRLIIANQSIQLNSAFKKRLKPNPGQKFTLGIRPEHITLSQSEVALNDEHLVLTVNLVEPLGREILVKATAPESNLTLNLIADAGWQGQSGDRLWVKFAQEKLFIFDSNSGKTL